jgi:cullin-associated NEDD8-dissociated protein 1
MDAATEKKICTAVLRLLHDKSNDVQAIAVKTLGVLLTTVQQEQVLEIADSLADQVLDASKNELRDVYAIGLRTLVKTVPAAMGQRLQLVGRLLDGIRSGDPEIVIQCLDILTDYLQRFGALCTRQHEPILQVCLAQLSSDRELVRKRAGNTLACLSVCLSDALLLRMVQALLAQTAPQMIRTMCTVSGAVGHRLQQGQIDSMIPIFLEYASKGEEDDMDEESNDLREACFMGFESFVTRCPNQVEPHLENIITSALEFMAYDPNYSYDVEDAVEEEEDYSGEDEYDDDEEDDEEDDESWKGNASSMSMRFTMD